MGFIKEEKDKMHKWDIAVFIIWSELLNLPLRSGLSLIVDHRKSENMSMMLYPFAYF